MFIEDVDVPNISVCEKVTKLSPALFKTFNIYCNKIEALRNNSNAGHSVSTSPAPSAAPRRERKRQDKDAEPDQETTVTEERKNQRKMRLYSI